MKGTRDADFCFIDPDIERIAGFIAAEITTVSQLVELQAQRETFEFGKREDQKGKNILSQAFHLAAKKMGLVQSLPDTPDSDLTAMLLHGRGLVGLAGSRIRKKKK